VNSVGPTYSALNKPLYSKIVNRGSSLKDYAAVVMKLTQL